jgi:Peptidase family M28
MALAFAWAKGGSMRRPTLFLALVLAGVLALMAAKNWLVEAPPVRAHAAAGQFDASRGKARLASILGDQRPHPADTAADDLVRARLVTSLQQIGLTPVVRDQFACNELYKQRGVSCARVRNVIAAIGPAAGKAVLLNAHYDSTPVGPAAADDGIGVATLLEVAAILKTQPLKRPVILLFNEGEELGLVGARAFLADPLSRTVDSLVNLEARGVRGPVNMFETSRPNAAPIAVFSAAVKRPTANSLSTDVYRLLPNYTDVNSFSKRGWLTLNLAPIGNETRYHSAGDDLAALDAATLQHMGDQTLALTQALANRAPRADSADRIFMDLAGRTLITLPLVIGAGLLIALIIGLGTVALRRGQLIRGTAVSIGTLLGSGAVAWAALALIGAFRNGMFWRAHPVWTHLAAYASVMFVGALLLSVLGRGASIRQLRAAFWFVYVIVGGMIGLVAPGGIVFFLFPPLLVFVGAITSRWWPATDRLGAMLAILLAYLSWGAMLGLLEELLNQGPMWIFAPLGALVILPMLIEAKPLIEAARLRSIAAIAGALALLGWAAAAAAPAYSADRQQRFSVQHVTDARAGKSWWSVLNDGTPLPPAYSSVGSWRRGKLPVGERERWIAAAPGDPSIKPPGAQVLSEIRSGSERTLRLRLNASGNDSIALVGPADGKIRSAGLPGFVRPIDPNESGKYYIGCSGRSCDGATLQLTIAQLKPVEFGLIGSRAPLPASAARLLAARPRFARPQYNRDESIVFTRVRL